MVYRKYFAKYQEADRGLVPLVDFKSVVAPNKGGVGSIPIRFRQHIPLKTAANKRISIVFQENLLTSLLFEGGDVSRLYVLN